MKNPVSSILAAMIVVVTLIGGLWMFTYRALSHVPATEQITVSLPQAERVAGQAEVLPEPETVTVERVKPWRKFTVILFNPLAFMVISLAIVSGGLLLMVGQLGDGRS